MYLLMEWEGYTGKYLVQGNNIWTEHSKVCVLWTRNKNFSLFFFFSQGRTRNSKFIEKCDFFTHFLFFLYVFATNLCECRARWLFLDWLVSTCPALHVSFLYGFLDGSYVNLPFSLIILLIIISLENLVLDQLKKSPNWYFLHSHHFSAWYCTDLI